MVAGLGDGDGLPYLCGHTPRTREGMLSCVVTGLGDGDGFVVVEPACVRAVLSVRGLGVAVQVDDTPAADEAFAEGLP